MKKQLEISEKCFNPTQLFGKSLTLSALCHWKSFLLSQMFFMNYQKIRNNKVILEHQGEKVLTSKLFLLP